MALSGAPMANASAVVGPFGRRPNTHIPNPKELQAQSGIRHVAREEATKGPEERLLTRHPRTDRNAEKESGYRMMRVVIFAEG